MNKATKNNKMEIVPVKKDKFFTRKFAVDLGQTAAKALVWGGIVALGTFLAKGAIDNINNNK